MNPLDLLFGLLNYGTQRESLDLQRQQADISASLARLGLIGQAGTAAVGIEEAQFNIDSLTEYLQRFPEYASLQTDLYQQQGEKQLKGLTRMLGGQNVAGALRGFGAGPSTATVAAEEAKQDVVDFAGSDMVLGGAEGLYERGLSQLEADLDAARRSAEGQLGVWQTTLDTLYDTQSAIDDALEDIPDPDAPTAPAAPTRAPDTGLPESWNPTGWAAGTWGDFFGPMGLK